MKEFRKETAGGSKAPTRMSSTVAKWLPDRLALIALSVALAAPALASPQNTGSPIGAVYVASNDFGGNQILTFLQFADGSLAPAGPGVPTNGLGSGPYLLGFPVTDDPLASTSSLIVDQQRKLLFVANAGSNDVSVFAIDPLGLTRVDTQPSGGVFPVSLAFRDGTLFVLNAADNSLGVFSVDDAGQLTPVQTCPLPDLPSGADPILPGDPTHSPQPVNSQTVSQVGVSPDGKQLVVVSKEGALSQNFPFPPLLGSGRIYVYELEGHDHTLKNCGNPAITALPINVQGDFKWPFSFAWSQEGQLLLTEIFGSATSLAGSAVSSFELRNDGLLTPISVSVGNGQGATCWIVSSGRFAYTTNFASDNLSRYAVEIDGQLALVDPPAAVGPGFQEFPIDVAVSRGGRFLYQLTPGSARIRPFEIDPMTGALTALTPVPDGLVSHSGQAGIATVDLRVETAFDFKPHDLNLKSKDRWVTGYLRPPAPYLASQIDVASIRLNGTVAVASERPPKLKDQGRTLRVEFLRSAVAPTLTAGDHVPVTVTGVIASEAFFGIDHIRAKAPRIHAPRAGDQLAGGATAQVTWDPPDGTSSVTLLSSLDDGVNWSVEANDIPNTGSYTWQVPGVATDRARLEVMAVYESDESGVVPDAEYAVSEAFAISTALDVKSAGASLALRATSPVVGPLVVSFSLAGADRASLAVYDVSGREVVAREVGASGPGWHTASLGNLPAGIYLVRLSQAGRTRSGRAVVLQ